MVKSESEENKIELIMRVLEKHFHYTSRTTLNRMKNEKADAFKILISCLLSLRTKDENTEKVSKQLFAVASTPKQIANLPTKRLEKLIYSSGHYHKKAQTLKHVSREIINRFKGKVPNDKQALLSIKGIGPKTANIVLCFAYNECVIPVDVNVHRVSNRLGLVCTNKPEITEGKLMKVIPKKYWRELNGIFVLHGKTFCVPISPKCSICPVNNYCPKIGVKSKR